MRAMGQEIPRVPSLAAYPLELRTALILEEAHEFMAACGLQEDHDSIESSYARVRPADPGAMLDALVDLVYVVVGAASAMGVDLDRAFDAVHTANMAKLGPDGKPIRRADGKILKPEGWKPSNLAEVWQAECQRAEEEQRAEKAWRTRRISQLELELKNLKEESSRA